MSEVKIHDYSSGSGESVVLIVRKGNRYGAAVAGERVRVDKGELHNRSTMECCMSEEAYEEFLADKRAKAKEPARPYKSPIAAAVERDLERLEQAKAERKKREEALAEEAPPEPPIMQPPPTTPVVEAEEEEQPEEELPPPAPVPQPTTQKKRKK